MARPNFFNENQNRTYPFVKGSTGVSTPDVGLPTMSELPDDFLVDCGFIMGPESDYAEGEHSVFLHKISRATEFLFAFEFRSDAPSLGNTVLIFVRSLTDPKFTTEFLESDIPEFRELSESLSVSASASTSDSSSASASLSISFPADVVCGEPYWSGYLVTGDMNDIATRMPVGSEITRQSDAESLVEPALVQNLNQGQVVSLNLANADRTRAGTPDYCPPNEWAFDTGLVYTNKECLQGDLKIRAGYNLSLTQDSVTNSFSLSPLVGAGAGEPCQEIKLFPEESPPLGATNGLLEGDFYCNEAVRTINGLQGPNLDIVPGPGVAITTDNVSGTVFIDLNLADLALCAEDES